MSETLNTFTIGLCVLAIFYIINKFRNRKFNEPPLVYYKYPIIGHTWDYEDDMDKFLCKCKQEYGEIFSIYVYGTIVTIACKEFSHEVLNSKNLSFRAGFEDQVPIGRILGLPFDYLNFTSKIVNNVFIGQMDLLKEKIQQSLYKSIDELIGECDEPRVIQNPRQVILTIIARAVTIVLVGDKLGHDKDFVDIFMNFSDELNKLLKVPRYVGFIHPRLFQQILIMKFRYGENQAKKLKKIVIEKIKPDIEERLEQERKYGDAWKPPADCIQFMLNQPGVDKENIDYTWIAGHLLAITFAAMLTTTSASLNFLLTCSSRPEYWDILLEEQEKINPGNDKIINIDQLEKLDSFLRETLRLTGHILALSHNVIGSEFKFSNGYQVPKGRLVRIYFKDVHNDEENYGPNSNEFDGFRHLGKSATHISRSFISFGLGRYACPGRHFSINEMKMLMSILIKKYKITTKSGERPPNIIINGLSFPQSVPIIFEKRK